MTNSCHDHDHIKRSAHVAPGRERSFARGSLINLSPGWCYETCCLFDSVKPRVKNSSNFITAFLYGRRRRKSTWIGVETAFFNLQSFLDVCEMVFDSFLLYAWTPRKEHEDDMFVKMMIVWFFCC